MNPWDASEIIGGKYPFKWSLMTATDRATMRRTVDPMCNYLSDNPLNFLEIGTYNGSTAWGVKGVVEGRGKKLNYWGIDTLTHDTILWPEANMVIGDSTKIFWQIPNLPFDILFIDGPHSTTNCMLDFLNFAPKVKVGGLILFHDSSPASQCKLPFSPEKEAEYKAGGFEIPIHEEFGTAVLIALEKLGLSTGARTDFELVSNNWTDEPYGGISIYRKLK
jgi:Methyltransferase domain